MVNSFALGLSKMSLLSSWSKFLLNLIDSSQGKVYRQDFGTREIIEMDIDQDTGQYIYGNIVEDDLRFESKQSTYRIKIGVKYTF